MDTALTTETDQLTAEFVRAFAPKFLDAWNSRDATRLTALSHANVVWEDPFIPAGSLVGHDALAQWVYRIWRAMPDLRFEIVDDVHVALDGKSLMVSWRGTGTMTGPLEPPGFAPTNNPVHMAGADTHWFHDGLLTHVRTVTDTTAVARQIGAAPEPGTYAERLGVLMQRLVARRARRR